MSIRTEASIVDAVKLITKLGSNIPVMCWGSPGIGKTKTIEALFKEIGYRVIHVLAGQSEPTDIGGIPFPGKIRKEQEKDKEFKERIPTHAEYLAPWWAFLASSHPDVPVEWQGKLVIFFDDIVTAHEQTQAALYKVIDEKRCGSLEFRDNVRMIAAGNRIDDMSAVIDMPKALCNRFMHLYVKPNVDHWLNWAIGNGIHPHVVFFIRQHLNRLDDFEEAKDSTELHAWATPRTWEMLSKAIFSLEEAGLSDNKEYKRLAVQGCIGALASTFITSIEMNYSVVPIEKILKNPDTAEIPKEPDRLYATVSNLEHFFLSPTNQKHYKAYAKYTLRLPEDFGFLCARQYFRMLGQGFEDENLFTEILSDDVSKELLNRWGEKDVNL